MILHLVDSGGLYGIERMLISLLPKLAARGCAVTLACFGQRGRPSGQIGEAIEAAGVSAVFLDFDDRMSLRGLRSLNSALSTTRPSLLHVHGYKAGIIGGGLALARGIPVAATYHSEAGRSTADFSAYYSVETHLLRRFRGVVAVSQPIANELTARGVAASRVTVIGNGTDDLFRNRAADFATRGTPPTLLVLGRLVIGKNVQLLIDAVARLRIRYPGITLVVAGEGSYRAELEARAAKAGVTDLVRFIGFDADVAGLLERCDVFAMPSRTEGMPISLLQAMSAGVPIVISAVGSIPSVARDQQDALLIPPDNPDALFAALSRILDDPSLRATLGASARARFLSEYTADHMTERYADFYTRMRV